MSTACLDEEIVFRFVSGQLSAGELAGVDAHLATCDECRGVVADAASSLQLEEVETEPQAPANAGAACSAASGRAGTETLRPGDRVGRYEVVAPIGSGAMGIVYLAHDPDLNRRITLKLLRDHVSQAQTQLLHEAQAMARLSHPNVVTVHDVGMFGEQVFVAMEFVDGETLDRWLRHQDEGSQRWREILRVFGDAGRGLAAAHAVGIVHRDFKPHNVLVGADGRVRVTDFGLARPVPSLALADDTGPRAPDHRAPDGDLWEAAVTSVRTQHGAIKGTPAYMAPEQFRCEPTDARTDQFSFCVALYEGLHGHRPFQATTFDGLATAVLSGSIRPPERRAGVPAHLKAALHRGLSVDPAARFPSMNALLEALGVTATVPGVATRAGGRRWAWVAVLAGAAAIGFTATIAVALRWRSPEAERARPTPASAPAATPRTSALAGPIRAPATAEPPAVAGSRPADTPATEAAPTAALHPRRRSATTRPPPGQRRTRKSDSRSRSKSKRPAHPAGPAYDDEPLEPTFARPKHR